MSITYDEVRTWARWLNVFTAEELADALGDLPVAYGEQGVLALLDNKIITDTGITLEGRHGQPQQLYEYVPLPSGPREHLTEVPPEIIEPRRAGGDYLRVPRGLPVAKPKQRGSVTGTRRPGRVNNVTKGR